MNINEYQFTAKYIIDKFMKFEIVVCYFNETKLDWV